MTINLTPDVERALTSEATRRGTSVESLVLDCLRSQFVEKQALLPQNGSLADFLADMIGVIDSGERVPGGARMSENTGKKFAEGMLQKKQQGRL